MSTPPRDFEQFNFTPDYAVEVEPEFPGDGDWGCPVIGYDRDGQVSEPFESRWGPPLVVRVKAQADWVGSFPAGGIGGITGVFACPSPTDLCVVADGNAYLVDVRHPEQGATVPLGQVSQVVPIAGLPLLLLARMIDMAAIGAGGVQWRSRRLCLDGLMIVTAYADSIRCTGEFLEGIEGLEVDPATGAKTSGPPLPQGWPDE